MGVQYSRESVVFDEKISIQGSEAPGIEQFIERLNIHDNERLCQGSSEPSLLPEALDQYSSAFWKNPKSKLALNAILANDPTEVIVNRQEALKDQHVFNVKLELEGNITNQRQSGRCWLFAGTNVMRKAVIKKFNLRDDFELSQNFLYFYDKLEKANWFLENMIDLSDEDINDRVVQYLLKSPVGDGGQWDMFVNLVQKYGIVPKADYPETTASTSSARLNWLVTVKLREYAAQIRKLAKHNESKQLIRSVKDTMMTDIYRILVIFLGEPPRNFDWEVTDKDGKFFAIRDLTPKKFSKDVVKYDVANTMSLINDPRNTYSRLYTVARLGNVIGGSPIRYVNTAAHTMKSLAIQVLKSGSPVWFGCDVTQFSNKKYGALNPDIYDYGVTFDIEFALTKEERLLYGESLMTHAMVFTGVHLDQKGTPVRWRVENSWGPDTGDKGFWVMSDTWFSEFVYQIVLEKNVVPKKLVALLDTDPTVLPAYDPMGALA